MEGYIEIYMYVYVYIRRLNEEGKREPKEEEEYRILFDVTSLIIVLDRVGRIEAGRYGV